LSLSFVIKPFFSIDSNSNLSQFDHISCKYFPSTCDDVARITSESDNKTDLLKRHCKYSDSEHCLTVSRTLLQKKDNYEALDLLDASCKRNDLPSCVAMGMMYTDGLGVDVDLKRAESLFNKACDAEEYSGCTKLGHLYENKKSI